MTRKQVAATLALALPITDGNWLYKERTGGPGEPEEETDAWCGVLPLRLVAGDPVTAQEMRALFGHGLHPLADARAQHFDGSNITLHAIDDAMRLGTPFRVVDEATPFRVEVAKRIVEPGSSSATRSASAAARRGATTVSPVPAAPRMRAMCKYR